jgi:hypothetical protein
MGNHIKMFNYLKTASCVLALVLSLEKKKNGKVDF